jgi:hypothetical protein
MRIPCAPMQTLPMHGTTASFRARISRRRRHRCPHLGKIVMKRNRRLRCPASASQSSRTCIWNTGTASFPLRDQHAPGAVGAQTCAVCAARAFPLHAGAPVGMSTSRPSTAPIPDPSFPAIRASKHEQAGDPDDSTPAQQRPLCHRCPHTRHAVQGSPPWRQEAKKPTLPH